MFAIIEVNSSARQQVRRWTRVKRLRGGRLKTENQMCPSVMFFCVFVQNKWWKLVSSFFPATGTTRSI